MSARFRHQQERRGFTLVELLTVIIIIALLATLGLAVQRASVESARRSRTQTTIAKIDHVLSGIYEKYQYRKVPLLNDYYSDAQLLDILTNGGTISCSLAITDANREKAQRTAKMIARTVALRELLQMDMPTSVYEVVRPMLSGYNGNVETPLSTFYKRSVDPVNTTNAELLYLIVMNADPEARTLFHDREIGVWEKGGRTGGKVFLDGWGNPICFLRWAPGLVDSDRQPTLTEGLQVQTYQMAKRFISVDGLPSLDQSELDKIDVLLAAWGYSDIETLEQDRGFQDFLERCSDPLDPMGVADGWYLTPLVYSWGPDGEPGMLSPNDDTYLIDLGEGVKAVGTDPFMGNYLTLGLPDYAYPSPEGTGDEEENFVRTQYAKDNITNHSAVEN